jgi:glutathione S-transferase
MILVGQYDSPFVRRVAVSLRYLGVAYEHDTRSIFGDFDAMRQINPMGRIPSLILDGGECLIDSGAILDWIDQTVGPQRALIPPAGVARRDALQRIALASGAIEKIGGGVNYERLIRPKALRWNDWIERCGVQGRGALAALDRLSWPDHEGLNQSEITTGCLLGYLTVTAPDFLPPGLYPTLEALWTRLCARPEFVATSFDHYAVPRG